MQKIAFTLCSNNYLAHAKTLGDSIKQFNPDIHFVIGLVDRLDPKIDYKLFESFEILMYDKLGCLSFDTMLTKYNVIEFNTAVKPFYFEYFFKQYGEGCLVYYLDPDIACYSDFSEMNALLKQNTYLLTPHITRVQREISPFETMFLNVGVYNLGFIGIRYTSASMEFLKWWQYRLIDHCLIDYARGLFVDQIWINFITVLFDNAYVIKSPAYNMACWNFHERTLIEKEGYYVNDVKTPLVFFHFSGFKPTDMNYVSKIKIKELSLDARPDLKKIFYDYADTLKKNGYDSFSKVKPLLNFGSKKFTFKQKIGRSLKYRTNSYIRKFFEI